MKLSNSLTLAAILTTAACEQTSTPANLHTTSTVDASTLTARATIADCLADQSFLQTQQHELATCEPI